MALTTVHGYPTGLQITLAVRTRHPIPDLFDHVTNDTHNEDHFHWAITYPDGTTAVADLPHAGRSRPHAGGTEAAVDATYWLTPLPPAGTIQIMCRLATGHP